MTEIEDFDPAQGVSMILPRLPPAPDGIGDFARQLCRYLFSEDMLRHRQCSFFVMDGAELTSQLWPDLLISEIGSEPKSLSERLIAANPALVILHYVGYGYAHDGSPNWLSRALTLWRKARPQARLLVMFHETWATGYPWQRVFWHTGKQRSCVSQLLDLADIVVTSTFANARDLHSLNKNKAVNVIGVGSNFENDLSDDRALQLGTPRKWQDMLIFGREQPRLAAINKHKQLIIALAKRQLIKRFVCAGESSNSKNDKSALLLRQLTNSDVIGFYNFSPDHIPNEMRSCGSALMYTQSTNLLKSTAFHFAASQGQVAVTLKEDEASSHLVGGKHYLWYQKNNHESILSTFENTNQLSAISSAAADVHSRFYSWPQIARQWRSLI